MHMLALVYLSKSFLPTKSHQSHAKEFIKDLENIVNEKPEYARDCDIDNVKWNDIKETLKAMWRKYQKDNRKQKALYEEFLAYSKIIFNSYE